MRAFALVVLVVAPTLGACGAIPNAIGSVAANMAGNIPASLANLPKCELRKGEGWLIASLPLGRQEEDCRIDCPLPGGGVYENRAKGMRPGMAYRVRCEENGVAVPVVLK